MSSYLNTSAATSSVQLQGELRERVISRGLAVSREAAALGGIVVQFALLVMVVHKYVLESTAFQTLITLALAGFVVQLFLPARWREAWFVALSFLGIGVVLGSEGGQWHAGTAAVRAGWLVGVGGVLMGVCYLPVRYWVRAGIIVALAGVLTLWRVRGTNLPGLMAMWPIIGSYFMFRLIVYMYDLSHERTAPPVKRSLSYFFMLPNICFTLFPVVDYKTFSRVYSSARLVALYQKGLRWMLRGIIHLLLYRVVYYHLAVDPSQLHGGADVIRFFISNSMLYLRVSGEFHIIVGLLHLFGFAMPETNRNYFLASSFTDYWRRVNIYWKDFILKVFYYPLYFRLKRLGPTRALVLATLGSFVISWLLHSYQWFWLRGVFPLTWQDMVFWGVLAVLVLANVLWESKQGRKRASLKPGGRSWRDAAWLALCTGATFTTVCLLWSIWNCDSLGEWLSIWHVADRTTALLGVAVVGCIMLARLTLDRAPDAGGVGRGPGDARGEARRMQRDLALGVAMPVLLLIAIGNRWVPSPLPAGALQFVESLSFTKPNARDAAKMERSYYDGLMDVGRFNPELWSTLMQKPANWIEIGKSSAQRPRNDLLEFELVPSKATPINGVLFTTNRWGMRDRDYPLVKPAGTYRVALLGSSHLMGYEIADDLTFENLVEKRLKSPPPHAAQPHYELMNFGVYYYSAIKQALLLEQKVLAFKPDAVIMFSHSIESEWCINHLADVCRNRTPIKQQYLQDVLKRAGAKPEMSQAELRRRLNPFGDEVVRWAYAKMVRTCRENGIRPIWVFLPMAVRPEVPATVNRYVRWADEAGFLTLDLRGIYQGYDRRTLQVAAWDDLHPNVEGNRLIAEKLYKVFTTDPRFGFVVAPGRDEGQKAKDAVSTGKD